MEGIETTITHLSDDVFDQLMGDVPDVIAGQNHLIGSEAPKEKVTPKVKNKPVQEDEQEEIENDSEQKSIITKTSEELESDIDELLEDNNSEESTNSNKTKNNSSNNNSTSEILKAKYEGLVERGIWEPLDDESLEEFEWTEDNYGKLTEQQAIWAVEKKWDEKVSSYGYYGTAILEHIENGGNPEDVISLFKEMKEVKDIDTSTDEGKIALLEKYYVDELGWSKNKFKRTVDILVDNNELDEEVEFVNSKIEDSIKTRVEAEKKQALEARQKQEELQRNFAMNVQKTVTSRQDISKKEQQEILDSLLRYDKKLPDGRIVNQFTIDFMEVQKDMDSYIDFVRFIKNPKKFKESIETKAEEKANKKNWNLIKGGAALNRASGTKDAERISKTQRGLVLDYKSILDR